MQRRLFFLMIIFIAKNEIFNEGHYIGKDNMRFLYKTLDYTVNVNNVNKLFLKNK